MSAPARSSWAWKVGRALVWTAVGFFFLSTLLGAVSVQQLSTSKIGFVGHLETPVDHPVTLLVARPRGYGLTAAERAAGVPELNDPHAVEVIVGQGLFEVHMPPADICVTRFMWQDTPPPPFWWRLRFSDAPDEEYMVWSHRGASGYRVRNTAGIEVPKSLAAWRLRLGGFRPPDRQREERIWLLDVRFERQAPDGDSASGDGLASA